MAFRVRYDTLATKVFTRHRVLPPSPYHLRVPQFPVVQCDAASDWQPSRVTSNPSSSSCALSGSDCSVASRSALISLDNFESPLPSQPAKPPSRHRSSSSLGLFFFWPSEDRGAACEILCPTDFRVRLIARRANIECILVGISIAIRSDRKEVVQ